MRRIGCFVGLGALSAAMACGSGSPTRPAQGASGGSTGTAGSAAGAAGTGAAGSAGASGSAGAAGGRAGVDDAGADADADAPETSEAAADDGGAGDGSQVEASDAPAPTPPLCNPSLAWSSGIPLAISTGADQFGAVTPDERTLVWTSTASGAATVYYADRADATVPFANPVSLALTGVDVMSGPVAISPDGLRLALEASDSTFFAVTRPDRSSPFGAATDTTEFAAVNGEIFASEAVVKLGDPVYGADGETFYYSRFPVGGAQGIATIFEASRMNADPWSDGIPVNGDPVQETNDEMRRRPSGISADARTIFYWDGATGAEMMAWRTTADGAFANAQSIGAKTGAQPNGACTALYYSAPADGGTGLFVAAAR